MKICAVDSKLFRQNPTTEWPPSKPSIATNQSHRYSSSISCSSSRSSSYSSSYPTSVDSASYSHTCSSGEGRSWSQHDHAWNPCANYSDCIPHCHPQYVSSAKYLAPSVYSRYPRRGFYDAWALGRSLTIIPFFWLHPTSLNLLIHIHYAWPCYLFNKNIFKFFFQFWCSFYLSFIYLSQYNLVQR